MGYRQGMGVVYLVGGHGYVGSRIEPAARSLGDAATRLVVISREGDTRGGVPSQSFETLAGLLASSGPASVVWLLEQKHGEQKLLTSLLPAIEDSGSRVVFASTATVYGDRGDGLCDESTPIDPPSEHARSKADRERQLAGSGVRHCVLRLGVLYGPDETGRRVDRTLKMIRAGRESGTIRVTGAAHWRGWLHRDQAAHAFYRAAVGEHDGVFVVAGENHRLGDVARHAAELTGAAVVETDDPDPYSYRLDAGRARSAGLLDQRDDEALFAVMQGYAED